MGFSPKERPLFNSPIQYTGSETSTKSVGNIVKAIDDYNIATTILPTYAYAWYDMFLCYADLAKRDEVDLAAMRLALAKTKKTGEGLPGLEANHIAQLENILARFERENGRDHGPSPH